MSTAASLPPLLSGVRAVEIGKEIAVPLCGMVLAEQGAEVVRVVPRGLVSRDAVQDALLARGKTEVVLDLDTEDGRRALRRLLRQADVLLENLPVELRARWLGPLDALRQDNPGLITVSVPGFPDYHPLADLPDYEHAVGTAGYLYDKPIGMPQVHSLPVGSVMAGLHSATAVVACLIARLKGGRGQHVDMSVYHANLFAQVLPILVKTGVPRGFLPLKMVGTPFMSPWLCADERYIYLHMTLPAHTKRFLELLEQNGYPQDVRSLRGILSAETLKDPSQVKSIPEAKQIRLALARVFGTRSADAWERLLGQELCCIKVRTVAEWMEDSRAAGMEDVCQVDDPQLGPLLAPGPAFSSPERPPRLQARTAGRVQDVTSRWEAEPRPAALPADGAPMPRHPLEGFRVLDLSRVIAGPCAARVLAEMGAEVISVQNPTSLDWALSFHLVFNAGKKSVTLDFTKDAGKAVLWKLFDGFRPHAFIQNYRHLDVAKAVGVDPEAMHARRPDLVYTHLNAYGNQGGWRDRPGFEQVVQAVTGIQLAYGRGGKPKLLPTPIIDIGSGLSGALATLVGLYHREKTGLGSFSSTHLTSTALLFQVNRVAAHQREEAIGRTQGKLPWDAGQEIIGSILRARDGFACLCGPRDAVRRWLLAAYLAPLPAQDDAGFFAQAAKLAWLKPLEHWQQSLKRHGMDRTVCLVPAPRMSGLLEHVRRTEPHAPLLVRKREYPGCPSPLTFVRNPLRLSLTPLADIPPPPVRGGDTHPVLGHLGVAIPADGGVVPYPGNKPLLAWAASFVRWGYFAWRSGNI